MTFGGRDFRPAFARCCFPVRRSLGEGGCIAANLLVFTSPIRILSCRRLCHTIRRRSYSRIYINAGMDFPWYGARAGECEAGSRGRVTFGGWDFSLAFARCCLCIAASLLVFTSPIRVPSLSAAHYTALNPPCFLRFKNATWASDGLSPVSAAHFLIASATSETCDGSICTRSKDLM